MAKEKIDYGKLLGKKRAVKKAPKTDVIEKAVEIIHQKEPAPVVVVKEEKVRTKRVTLDIPIPLHAEIRKKTFDMGITMKKYFLDLAKEDL